MAERALSTDLKKLLLNNEPFTYAHLVKFERPSKELLNGTFSTDAKRYAYDKKKIEPDLKNLLDISIQNMVPEIM